MGLLQKDKYKIVKVDDNNQLALRALELFIQSARDAIDQRGVFYVAISGGSTPSVFYELLSEESSYSQIDWEKVHLFWVDERCVHPSADASNFGMAVHTFLLDVPIPDENVHRVTGEETDYAKAAKEYAQTILDVFGLTEGNLPEFDLIMLGMGADAHIASLMSNSYALFDRDDLVSAVYLLDGFSRITLTVPVLKHARQLVVLISGQAKAEIVREVFEAEPDVVKYPVHSLWSILDRVTWIMDQQAGAFV
ncbi:MAG: 6-phosphogluconolactonase [Planctomycetota bacterium]|jgi:6-phosphogluconolactonase